MKIDNDRVVLLSQSVSGFQNCIRHERLLSSVASQQFNITLVTAPDKVSLRPARELWEGFDKIVSVGLFSWRLRRGGLDPFDVLYRCYLILRLKPTVVHCDGHRPATLLPALLAKLLGAKLVVEWVDLFSRDGIGQIREGFVARFAGRCDEWLEVKAKKVADHVLAISTYLRDRAINQLGISEQKVTLLRGGSMQLEVDLLNRGLRKRQEMLIGFLGFELADLNDLLDALRSVTELNNRSVSARLVITGKDVNKLDDLLPGDYSKYLIKRGWLSTNSYEQLLTELDAFVLPLRDDPRNHAKWPMKLGDYLSSGAAIVASNVGEVKAINDQYDCLYVYQHPSEMAGIFGDLFLRDIHDLERVEKCINLANGALSWSSGAEVMIEVYSNLRNDSD